MDARSRHIFFVLGCQKSGTTWVQKLLNAHPNVACGGEGHLTDLLLPLLHQAVSQYNTRQQRRQSSGLDVVLQDQDFAIIARQACDVVLAKYLRAHPEKDIRALGDKTPEYALGLHHLAQLYPGARFVHVIRDGRDGAVSGWWHYKRLLDAGEIAPGNTTFASFHEYALYFAKHHWTGYITHARAHGAALGPDRFLEVRYEDLHADPARTTGDILRHLSVDDAPAVIDACLNAANFTTLASGRSRGQEDRSDFFRKGIVGDWQDMFDERTLAAFHDIAGGLLDDLGYATDQTVALQDDAATTV